MKRVLNGKQLVATQKLIDKYTGVWPDTNIINEIKQGAPLTGAQSHAGLFPCEVSLPGITSQQLRSQSVLHNQSTLVRAKSSGDNDLDVNLWQQTLDEIEKGWLSGPFYKVDEACSFIKDQVHLSRRFPIQHCEGKGY